MNKPIDPQLLADAATTAHAALAARVQAKASATTATIATSRASRSSRSTPPPTAPRSGSDEPLGYPGQPDYTRGIYATMHRGRTWTQRQLVGLGTPADYNQRLLGLLERGATAVSLIPCNSVYRGFDMDSVEPELLGTCGVVVNNAEHMDRCLEGVDVGEISCAMNDPSPFTLLAFMLVAAERRGIDWKKITGTSNQSDYLSHYVANHMFYRLSLPGARRVLMDHIAWCREFVPRWNPMSVVGQHMQQAGATPAEAMAFTLVERGPERRGLHRPRHGPRRVPAALHLLLRHLAQLLRGDRQVPRRPAHLGAARARAPRREEREGVALQVPRPDLGRRPDAPAAAQQHRPRHGAGDGRHLRRPAVAPHRRLRRGLRDAERGRRAHRRRDPEHPARGSAPDRRDRSARRLVLRRVADRRRWKRRSSRS